MYTLWGLGKPERFRMQGVEFRVILDFVSYDSNVIKLNKKKIG